ncbi:MAG: hypothetical protein HY834_17985 [Devosia nanyangense]|uniref:Uncharacterized protein n=1 Tax=Devosia nanyangense TaxID=1228055 RepID=A0A933L3K1_9HYPH|nr:hypothetical protein [Devosia nanyangense]
MTNYDPDYPPRALRELYTTTERQLSSLCRAIEPLARRRPERRVPEPVLADVRPVLAATVRLLRYDEGWGSHLVVHGTPDWATLMVKLALAADGIAWFYTLYIAPPPSEAELDHYRNDPMLVAAMTEIVRKANQPRPSHPLGR